MLGEYHGTGTSVHFKKYILSGISGFSEDEHEGALQDIYTAHRLFGTCFITGSEVVEEVGLFDPLFYMYGEDDDLGNRVRETSGNILLCTSAFVRHKHTLSNNFGEHRIRFWMLNSRLMLRIRYTGISKVAFIARCLRFFVRSLMFRSPSIAAPLAYLYVIMPNLRKWSAIKSRSAATVKDRIEQSLRDDML
jgi:GT2 family glycosyltransferase